MGHFTKKVHVRVFNVSTGVWADALDYMKGLPAKFPDDQIYAIGGPVFDYNGDGRLDTDLTAAK